MTIDPNDTTTGPGAGVEPRMPTAEGPAASAVADPTAGDVPAGDGSAGAASLGAAATMAGEVVRTKIYRRPKHPWLVALAVVLVMALLFELYVRGVEGQFATVRAGDSSEMILKADQVRQLATDNPHVGVIFFGNSMMDAAVSPAAFLANSSTYKSAYNAAVVGAPIETRKRWADEIVLRDLDPELVVIGIHPVDLLHTDFLNLNQDPTQADVVFSKVLRETDTSFVGATERALDDHVATVRNRGILRQPKTLWDATLRAVKGERKPKEFDVRTLDDWKELLSKGDGEIGLFHKAPFKPESIKGMGAKLQENFQPKNFVATELDDLLDYLKTTGKKAVVVIPPIPLDAWVEAGVPAEAVHKGTKMITDEATAKGVRVIDFTDRGYKRSVFADVLHMNDYGSLQFSKELAKELDKPA